MPTAVIIHTSDNDLCNRIKAALENTDVDVRCSNDIAGSLEQVREHAPDVALVDVDAPGGTGLQLIRELLEMNSSQVIVALAKKGADFRVAEALRVGAIDHVPFDVGGTELEIVLRRAVESSRLRRSAAQYGRSSTRRTVPAPVEAQLIGECEAIVKVREAVDRAARLEGEQPAPVLVLGETGTGKDLVARLIHQKSERSSKPFIDVNCTALPESLVEAELFGFEAGAFTDARAAKPGLFEAADQGTIFLDEIGELAQAAQAKLLKVLEKMEVRRVGSVEGRKINVQVVAATNRDLRQAVADGEFRSDLYYRLNVMKIRMPPLRDRGDDLILLANWFAAFHGQRYGKTNLSLSINYMRSLKDYSWPGNVRELSNVIERSVVVATSDSMLETPGFESEMSGIKIDFSDDGTIKDLNLPSKGIDLEEVEKQLLRRALEDCDGNIAAAARRLGITRERMRYRMEKYGLS